MTGTGMLTVAPVRDALQHQLATYDPRGNIVPRLALAVPSTSDGSWIVRSDGTMQTTYHLRPDVTWHDGVPVTAQDFAFALRVVMDPDLPVSSTGTAKQIARLDTPDDQTLVIEWQRTFATANAIVGDDLGPFPSHLLKGAYEAGDKQRFWNLPYWNREFVGEGPFRLTEWQPGSHILLEAYDGFYAGRPKIDRLTLRVMGDADVIVASMLAGAVDFDQGGLLGFDQQMAIYRGWGQAGQNPVLVTSAGSLRYIVPQLRPTVLAVPELRDVRVRQALLLALDRQALADALFEGQGVVADTFIAPDDARWEWIKDSVIRYPRDTGRAQQLLLDAGLVKGPDGIYARPTGTQLVIPQWANASTQNEQEVAITSDQWKGFGVLTQQTILSRAQGQDSEYGASFPGVYDTSLPYANLVGLTVRFRTDQCASGANNWNGQNYGCYLNDEADRIIDRLTSAIAADDQRTAYQQLVRLQTGDLPLLSLYFAVGLTPVRQGLAGPQGNARPEGGATWNIADWTIQ